MTTMNKSILLGIDANLSPPAQHALRIASDLLEQSSPDVCLVLLHVIPVPSSLSFSWGMSSPAIRTFTPVTQQRMQAEHALWKARTALKQQGVAPERIAWLQRVGTPADEIVKAARELGVDRIVIGSRGNTFTRRIGRVLMGSTSRRVMHHAPCPVTLVVPPGKPRARSLVAWYKEAVRRSLHEHSGSLLVFTACDVAQLFVPPKRTVGSKELEAAALALEQLASDGLLCCQKVKGEWRYLND
jgi:nucleotide-binding universal stress UspA family protein